VTGGAGYIGRFCIRELVAAGHAVFVIDREPLEDGFEPRVAFALGDIADRELVESVLRQHRTEVVLHLAADKSVAESMAAPAAHLRRNVGGTLALLEAMVSSDVRRIVFSSSAAVYGTPERVPVAESARAVPDNPYGAGKLMVEQTLHWLVACHGLAALSLRYFNAACGADDGSLGESAAEPTNLIPRVMHAAAGLDGPVPIYGTDYETPDGTAIRDYVHVEDLARAHVAAVDVLGGGGVGAREQVLNLGTGRGSSVREVLDAAERAIGRPVPQVEAPRRPGDPAAVWADPTQAERVLGWRAERDLDDIVSTAWRWQQRSS
jgi:UDP-glucose-4-epimerase GalE